MDSEASSSTWALERGFFVIGKELSMSLFRLALVVAMFAVGAASAQAALLVQINYEALFGEPTLSSIGFVAGPPNVLFSVDTPDPVPGVEYAAAGSLLEDLAARLEAPSDDADYYFGTNVNSAGRSYDLDRIWETGPIPPLEMGVADPVTVTHFVPPLGRGFRGYNITGISQSVTGTASSRILRVQIFGDPVPEPSAAVMAICAAAGVGCARRKRS
jgi:hypothetical protein